MSGDEACDQRTFSKDVLCTVCARWIHVVQVGHRIKAEGYTCKECGDSKYRCAACGDSGHVLNTERALGREEAGPSVQPGIWDPCPKGCTGDD